MKKIVSVCLAGILLLCYSIYVFDAGNGAAERLALHI